MIYDDEEINEAFRVLFGDKCKCKDIHKDSIYVSFFFAWNLDHGQGIVYSITGKEPEIGEYIDASQIALVEPLGYENWYFCVVN